MARAVLAAAMLLAGCGEQRSGPVVVSAIGEPPRLVNPNLQPLDAASAYLASSVAQGLVRFDASGQVEPALAQSWIVSNDGLRYTFRLSRLDWEPGQPVTAEQVAARLRAAISEASRNPLKPQLGLIDEIEAMTGNVLEISLKGPRPNFLQLLAQPEMAIIRNGKGTGPYDAAPAEEGARWLRPREDDAAADALAADGPTQVLLRGEGAAMAVARFTAGLADMVTGGTAGDLPIAREANLPAASLRFDPVQGLFGLAIVSDRGPIADANVRQALSMAVDREDLFDSLDVPGLQPRGSLLPAGLEEVPEPALPQWTTLEPGERRSRAREVIAASSEAPIVLRVAMPSGHGYELLFAHLRRDWRAIGVRAERVGLRAAADLRLIDRVAPITQAAWYLRSFACSENPVCDTEADALLAQARTTQVMAERQQALVAADRLLAEAAPFIPLAAPVRWSLVSQRLTGFQTNGFASHFPGALLAGAR